MRPVPDKLRRAWLALSARRRYQVVLTLAVAFFVFAISWRDEYTARPYIVQAVADELGYRQVEDHAAAIRAAAEESEVDPLLIAAICFKESRGRSGQVSSAGAMGLMQLVEASASDAARRLGIDTPTNDQLLNDAALNLRLGAAHIAWLLEHRGDWTMEQVLVAYNAGRSRLFQWIEAAGSYEAWVLQQENKLHAGERTNGALLYARGVLATMERFRERGEITGS